MKSTKTLQRQAGFSLVEIMVGLTVGLIASLIIAQVISGNLGTQNTNRAAADSMENGLFALQTLSTDIRSAGSGFAGSSAFSCYQAYSSYGSSGTWPNNGAVSWLNGNVALVPVAIKSVTSSSTWSNHSLYQLNSDAIIVRDAGRLIGAATATLRSQSNPNPSSGNPAMTIDRLYGFQKNDVALITDGVTCTLVTVDPLLDPTNTNASNGNGSYYDTNVNAGSGTGAAILTYSKTANLTAGYVYPATTSLVFNVGHAHESTDALNIGGINETEYFVPAVGAKLQYYSRRTGADAESTTRVDMADSIVAIKAQYGIIEPVAASRNNYDGTQKVAHWVGPDSGNAWTQSLDSTNSKMTSMNKIGDTTLWTTGDGPKVTETAKLIKAVRIVVVARSGDRQSSVVTQPCSPSGSRAVGPCPWGPNPTTSGVLDTDTNYPDPVIDLTQVPVPTGKSPTGDDAEWKHYRYRIYSTVIPVRSLVWNP